MATEISGSMSLEAFDVHLGHRMTNTLHSSTETKGRIEFIKGREVNLEISEPKDNMEIFQARYLKRKHP